MFRPTVAFDFDGVLHEYKSKFSLVMADGPTPGALECVQELLSAGIEVVVFSTRAREAAGKLFIKGWLKQHGFPKLKVDAEKPHAILYVDDRAYLFDGANWPTARHVRNFIPWNKRDQPWAEKRRMSSLAKKFSRIRELKDMLQDQAEGICSMNQEEAAELVLLLDEVAL